MTGACLALLASLAGCEQGNARDLPCDVQRVLNENCLGCHGEPPQFGAPIPLASYDDLHASVKGKGSDTLAFDVVLDRIQDEQRPMPPRPNRMSDADRKVLKKWIESGAPEGDEACESTTQDAGGVYLDPSTEPEDCESFYEFRAHGDDADGKSRLQLPADPGTTDRYMCFYFDAPWAADERALWLHSLVDNTEVLHHWILYGTDRLPRPAGTSNPCSAVQAGAYFLAGWAPGGEDFVLPSNVEMDLPSGEGSGLILEVHYYRPDGGAAKDKSGVRICTAPSGTREQVAGVTFTGSEGICLAPQSRDEVVGICDPADEVEDIHIIGAWPHMHKLGRHMKIRVLRADGREETLLDEPFDFASQLYYPFGEGEWVLHPGDRLETTCEFQNDTNERVPFGERTQDEMCYGFITTWPAGALENDPNSLIQMVGGPFQQDRRCMNPVSIFESCGGLSDFPGLQN